MTARLVLLLALPARALDLAIVGAGPVGTSAALRAAELGKSVALIDAPEFSGALSAADGEDLSFGAPSGLFSKALRDTAKKFSVETLRQMGLDDTSIWDQIKFSCASLARANARAAFLDVESAGVEYIRGKAVLADGGQTICIDNQRKLSPDNILLCTGSRPFRIPGIPFDGKRVFESDSINTLTYLPKSIAITGSGIVAIEFAQIFASLGAEVTLIVRDQNPARALSKIGLDKDIAAAVLADLKAKRIRTVKGAEAVGFDVPERPRPVVVKLQAPGGGPVKGSGPQELKVDAYLAAVGRKPNTDNLGLEEAGIELDEYGDITVDGTLRCRTAQHSIYAAGDVVGRPFLASTGAAQAVAAVGAMFSTVGDYCSLDEGLGATGARYDPASLASNPFQFPVGLWSTPEVAYFGLSKKQADSIGYEADEGLALYKQCLRGVVFAPEGLLKLVFEKGSGRILGVHIVGADACELIHYGMELVRAERTIQSVLEATYSAVTFHELYTVAARAGMDPKGGRARRRAAGAAWASRRIALKQGTFN